MEKIEFKDNKIYLQDKIIETKFPVKQLLMTPEGLLILIFDLKNFPDLYGRTPNLIALKPSGEEFWIAPLPEPKDTYYNMDYIDGRLHVNSHGFICEIDPLNGQIISKYFNK